MKLPETLFYTGHWIDMVPDSIVGANMGLTWVLSAPDGPHVGPMNLVIRGILALGKAGHFDKDCKHKWYHTRFIPKFMRDKPCAAKWLMNYSL